MTCTKLKVLIVEDDEIAQSIAKNALTTLGCTVDTADCGKEAIKLFKAKLYKLVFMDIAMLDMDGFTVTENFRAIEQAQNRKHVPILAVSAHDEESFKKRAKQIGIEHYLVKPVSMTQYKEVLKKFEFL